MAPPNKKSTGTSTVVQQWVCCYCHEANSVKTNPQCMANNCGHAKCANCTVQNTKARVL